MGLTVGSLFSGIGGLDLGARRVGMTIEWQVENDKRCQQVLWRHFPECPKYDDIRDFISLTCSPVACILGGDPCPCHSRARSNGPSVHPDLSGYFLAVVGRYGPQWVVRENVPTPTTGREFCVALEALGYTTIMLRMDAAALTGQSRQRDIVVGLRASARSRLQRLFQDCENGPVPYTTRLGTRQIIPALTTHRTRYDSRDCYIWENGRLRILDSVEREAFAGFPKGWTAGFSEATRARMLGNSAPPAWTEFIGQRIVECHASGMVGASVDT
jgi:DNA (cytosine-5)-methyltransferase 1